MISLQRLNGTSFWLNPELIEQIDHTPDTVITLSTGNNILVLNPVQDVLEKILDYRRAVAEKRAEKIEIVTIPASSATVISR